MIVGYGNPTTGTQGGNDGDGQGSWAQDAELKGGSKYGTFIKAYMFLVWGGSL
jgi:hypothetical protein